MAIIRETIRALRMALILWLLTAIVYPLLILGLGNLAFPFQAQGSILYNIDSKPLGSALIGQYFSSDRYFHGRPSAIHYSQGKRAHPTGISGGSNLAPSNPELIKRIQAQVGENPIEENSTLPADAIYTSASGLDPHISLHFAKQQLARVAKARKIKEDDIIPLLRKYTDGRFLGLFGEPGVNVVRLNYALDLQDINQKENQF
jgi:K+-transporting ATPase ATPase C chain